MLNKENVQQKLIEFRAKHKITHVKIQEKTGISRPTLSGIENGTVTPQLLTLYKLNQYIKTFGDKGECTITGSI